MGKKSVAVLFGGVSSEHDVSLASAENVINSIPEDKYDVYIKRYPAIDKIAEHVSDINRYKMAKQRFWQGPLLYLIENTRARLNKSENVGRENGKKDLPAAKRKAIDRF